MEKQMITQEDKDRIEAKAKSYASMAYMRASQQSVEEAEYVQSVGKYSWAAGATAELIRERERSAKLVEALNKIVEQKMLPHERSEKYAFNRNWHIAVNALEQYNKNEQP